MTPDDGLLEAVQRRMQTRGWDQQPVYTEEMHQDAAEFGKAWSEHRLVEQEAGTYRCKCGADFATKPEHAAHREEMCP